MKTTNVILIGVVGVGAVGAYMYMKNKKAENALLSGSMPATTPSGTAPSGTAPSGTAPSGTAPSGTPPQNNEVFLPSNNDLKLVEATVLLGKIKLAQLEVINSKKPFTGRKETGWIGINQYTPEYKAYLARKSNAPIELQKLIINLHELDYTLDANNKLVKLDPNRNKSNSRKAIFLQYEVISNREKMAEPFVGAKFKDNSGNENPINFTREYSNYKLSQTNFANTITSKIAELEKIDYELDANDNLVMLDPNRNKEWIKIQKLYLSLVNSISTPIGLLKNEPKIKELATYGYKIDPITKKLVLI